MKKSVVITLLIVLLVVAVLLFFAVYKNSTTEDKVNDMYNSVKDEAGDMYNDAKDKVVEEKDEMRNDGNVKKEEVAKDEDVISGVLDDIANTAEFDNILKPSDGNKEAEKLTKEEFIKRKDEFKNSLKDNMKLFKTSVQNGVNYVEYETSKVLSALGFSMKDGTVTNQDSKRITLK